MRWLPSTVAATTTPVDAKVDTEPATAASATAVTLKNASSSSGGAGTAAATTKETDEYSTMAAATTTASSEETEREPEQPTKRRPQWLIELDAHNDEDFNDGTGN